MTHDSMPARPLAEARGWWDDTELRGRWLREGAKLWLIAAGASFAAAAIVVMVLASQVPSGTPVLSGSGDLLVFLWSFIYFSSHLVPFDFNLSAFQLASSFLSALARSMGTAATPGAGIGAISVGGVGSLTLTALVCVLAVRSGARLERERPYAGAAGMAALRATGVALPYAAGNLLLFVVGRWHVSVLGGSLDAAPAAIGLVLPPLLVGAAAGFGAVRARARATRSRTEASLLRGAAHGAVALLVGMGLTLGLLAVAAVVAGAANAPSTPAPGSATGTADASQAMSGALAVIGLLAVVLYAANGVALAWAQNVGLNLVHVGPLGMTTVLAVAGGAVAGGAFVRSAADYLEQGAFVATFAFGSLLLAIASEPSVAGISAAPSPGSILVVAAVVATAGVGVARWLGDGAVGDRVRAWPAFRSYVRAIDRIGATAVAGAAPVAPVAAGAARCSGCGGAVGAGDRFCASCGTFVRGSEAGA